LSRIRKVALIEPKPPGYHVYSGFAMPRLGLPLLSGILKQRGVQSSIYCQDFCEIDYSDVLSSDLVGISTTTSTAPEAYRIADRVRSHGIPVVLGGSHVSFMADEALRHADFCVRGEGDYTLAELIEAYQSGWGYGAVDGLSYRIGDEVRHNRPRDLVHDLDALPFADLDAIRSVDAVKLTPISTSRGCPFACNFCSVVQMFGRGYRERSVENVIEEIEFRKPAQIFFYDDNFTANRDRTKKLLDMMLSRGIQVPWTAQARVDVVRDKELLKLMKRSGCQMLYIGFESVNPATLKEYNKHQSVAEIAHSVKVLHEHGIMTHGMFVFGAEQDDVSSLRATLRFSLKHQVDTVQFMILTPLPGTPYFKQMQEQGRLLTHDWQLYDGQHVVYQPGKMTPYELQKETFKAMKRFYSLWECVKMLIGPQTIAFAAKLNLNLLQGRWMSARTQLSSATKRWFYRAYGHFLIRKWEAANKDFGERIQALAQKARTLRTISRPSQEKAD
jgi:radical SAM superfamily enzyme YgiQ (UPF0313 family)